MYATEEEKFFKIENVFTSDLISSTSQCTVTDKNYNASNLPPSYAAIINSYSRL